MWGNSTFIMGTIGSCKFPVAESSNRTSSAANVINPSAMKSNLVLPPLKYAATAIEQRMMAIVRLAICNKIW